MVIMWPNYKYNKVTGIHTIKLSNAVMRDKAYGWAEEWRAQAQAGGGAQLYIVSVLYKLRMSKMHGDSVV